MDKEFIKMILSSKDGKDDRLIKRGELIDWELVNELCNSMFTSIQKAFYHYDGRTVKDEPLYLMELKCPCCGRLRIEELTKTETIETIRMIKAEKEKRPPKIGMYYKAKELICDDCKLIIKENKKREEKELNDKHKKEVEEKTEKFIQEYLNPNRKFKENISAKEKVKCIMMDEHQACSFNEEIIKEAVNKMSYSDFLKTPYWDGVRNYMLMKAHYSCQLCANEGLLNAHHKTYKNHGLEHRKAVSNNDLIVLCRNCHEKFHDKLPA